MVAVVQNSKLHGSHNCHRFTASMVLSGYFTGNNAVFWSRQSYKTMLVESLSEVAGKDDQWLNKSLATSVVVVFRGKCRERLAGVRSFLVLAASHVKTLADYLLDD